MSFLSSDSFFPGIEGKGGALNDGPTGGNPDNSNTCGNEASRSGVDNGIKHIKAMGYILVQWGIRKTQNLHALVMDMSTSYESFESVPAKVKNLSV